MINEKLWTRDRQWKNVCRNFNRKYPKYPSTYSAHSPVIWDILEKKVFITCPLSMHLTKLSLWESLLRSAKSVKRSRNIWKTWRPSFNRQFFYVQNWQKPTGSQNLQFNTPPDVRGCQEKIWKKSRWRNNWMCVW